MSRVNLSGYVVSDNQRWIYDFFGIAAFSPGTVRDAIDNNPQGETLTLELNSGGGSVFAGFEIYSAIRAASCEIAAEIQSLAGSATSTIASACATVLMSPVAQIMIHPPSTWTEGDASAHRQNTSMLDSITQSIINGYVDKCKGKTSRNELLSMLEATTWMDAHRAVDVGLADGILYQEEVEAIPENVVNCVGASIRAMASGGGGMPGFDALLARYNEAMTQEGKPPVSADGQPIQEETGNPQNDCWRQQSQLAIERARFH